MKKLANVDLKVSFKSHLALVLPLFVLMIALSIIRFAISYQFNDAEITRDAAYFSGTFMFVFTVLSAILHVRYSSISSGMTIIVKNQEVQISDKTQSKKFVLEDIKQVELKLTVSKYFGGIPYFPSENYVLGKLILNDGEVFMITSLLDEDLDWLSQLPIDKIERKVRIICL